MAKKEDILEALGNIDPEDNDSWTADGLPKVDVIEAMIGENVSRQEITDADPDFDRDKARLAAEGSGEGEDGEDPSNTSPENSGDDDDDDDGDEGDESDGDEMLHSYLDAEEPMQQGEFSKFMRKLPKESLRRLQEIMLAQQTDLAERKNRAADLEARIRSNLSLLNSDIRTRLPEKTNQDAIREFINSQSALREQRFRDRAEIMKHVSAEDFDPRAPIDRAMARRPGRGNRRPTRI